MSNKAIEKLLTLAADAERAAAAYRLAAAALNGHAVDKRVTRSATILDAALELDAARRGTKPKPKPKPTRQRGDVARAVRARRERTARVLATIAKKGPLTFAEITDAADGRRIGTVLSRRGYIKPVGDKYARTAKPFTV
jgi:hypothetical protein